MFWVPVPGQLGASGAPTASYPVPVMPPGVVPVQPGAALQAGAPPAFPHAVTTPTSNVAVPSGSNMQSADFSGSGTNTSSNSGVNLPSQRSLGTSLGGGAGVPMTASLSSSMAGSGTTDPRRVYMMSAPGMPVGYTPLLAPGCVPVGAVPMMPAGSYYPMTTTPMALYPPIPASSSDFNKSSSGPLFVSAPVPVPVPIASASGDFTAAVSFGSIPSAFSGAVASQTSSGVLWSESSGQFRSSNNRSGKTGDAGRGYEAGVYYEGRVKRFNPVRGYGFLSATHKLLKRKDVQKSVAAKLALAPESDALAQVQVSTTTEKELKAEAKKEDALAISTSDVFDNENESSTNPQTKTTAKATTAAAASDSDAPLINIITAANTEADTEIDFEDIVVIKGEEYVRKPVVMGDIFVHYHCLQRTPEELESEQNGALVNLPAGARVQFKAEVFVPARLMEEAQDSKQAAAMLNSIGISVNDDPNLLAGAIATKKGWGYQAMNVVQLPSQPNTQPRRGHCGKSHSVGNVSTTSMSSFSSARRSNTSSHGRSEQGGDSNALAPCSGQRLKIHVEMENTQLQPPSFESATANMKYTVPTAGGVVYYPAYTSVVPKQL